MKFRQIAVVLALLAPVGAYAAHCPADMRKIDDMLSKGPSLSTDEMAEVKKLRAEGEALHKSGNHGKSVEVLGEALKILDHKH